MSKPHTQDSDCTVNPVTDLCDVCGVWHFEPCRDCGARAFHKPGCPQDPSEISEVPSRTTIEAMLDAANSAAYVERNGESPYAVEIQLAAKLALEVGVRKVQQARTDGAPVMYTAGVEATAAETAEAILSLAKKPGVAA